MGLSNKVGTTTGSWLETEMMLLGLEQSYLLRKSTIMKGRSTIANGLNDGMLEPRRTTMERGCVVISEGLTQCSGLQVIVLSPKKTKYISFWGIAQEKKPKENFILTSRALYETDDQKMFSFLSELKKSTTPASVDLCRHHKDKLSSCNCQASQPSRLPTRSAVATPASPYSMECTPWCDMAPSSCVSNPPPSSHMLDLPATRGTLDLGT